ncbi:hypothetical protein [Faecalibaculum rodentium]|uniref:hypothetical protein n=1 Tax=Faecalibaculum rodentium TaxID=1702221 RepID=UPI00272A2996|nr:hypothetical protein [Faecalibaculum rodentium]
MEPRGFLTRLLECAFLFAFSAWLIRTAVRCLIEVWPVLAVIAILALIGTIGWRVYRHWRDTGQW